MSGNTDAVGDTDSGNRLFVESDARSLASVAATSSATFSEVLSGICGDTSNCVACSVVVGRFASFVRRGEIIFRLRLDNAVIDHHVARVV